MGFWIVAQPLTDLHAFLVVSGTFASDILVTEMVTLFDLSRTPSDYVANRAQNAALIDGSSPGVTRLAGVTGVASLPTVVFRTSFSACSVGHVTARTSNEF